MTLQKGWTDKNNNDYSDHCWMTFEQMVSPFLTPMCLSVLWVPLLPSFQFIEKHNHQKKLKEWRETLQHIYILSLIRSPRHVVLLCNSVFQQIMRSLFGFELLLFFVIFTPLVFQLLISIRIVFLLHKVEADLFNNLLIG